MKNLHFLISLLFLSINTLLVAQEVPYTLADRDRMIRLEETMTVKFEAIDQRFEAIDQRFEAIDHRFEAINQRFDGIDQRFEAIEYTLQDIRSSNRMLSYFILGGMLGLVGFILWDRRTFIKPFKEETVATKNDLKTLIEVLREQAKTDSKLAEILKSHHLL